MSTQLADRARNRFLLRFFPTLASYVILFAIANAAFQHNHPGGITAVAFALIPVLPILAGVSMVAFYIREERDEFRRDLFLRSLLWGLALTLSLTTVYGFLGLYSSIQSFPLYATYPLFWTIVALAQAIYSLRHRSGHE